ncbi:MAG: SAM-dependent methyltransferase [Bacteroidales bacterium]|nr:SAM-dependent methyltransferase [Bacteroidales bacterium]MDD3859280.1 SAM-dependent methyltransferase [Bacteroidales bacterium]
MTVSSAKLYLIPNLIGDTPIDSVLPASLSTLVSQISYFIVEDLRNSRRFLKKLNKDIVIDSLKFYELNQHTNLEEIYDYLDVCSKGMDIGLISEAGLPCIADPGNVIVRMAHEKGIKVVPIAGPSSIFMALMSSGLNGQNFAFNGYINIEPKLRIRQLKLLENKSLREGQSQIFMDTPYRNNKLFNDLLLNLNPDTYLCIASNISCENEFILTKKIAEWKKINIDLDKKPCIFII